MVSCARSVQSIKRAMALALPSLWRRSGCMRGQFQPRIFRLVALKYVFGCRRLIMALFSRVGRMPGME
jgi:hypothetical protein